MAAINLTNGNDRYIAGNGNDDIAALAGNDYVDGRGGHDHINGNPGNDQLYGGIGNDELFGGRGDDRLNGSDGDDLLVGGLEDDVYVGGRGRDIFAAVSTGSNVPGFDTIEDFTNGQDDIRIAPQVSWSQDLDTNGNGRLDNGDAYVSSSGRNVTAQPTPSSGSI